MPVRGDSLGDVDLSSLLGQARPRKPADVRTRGRGAPSQIVPTWPSTTIATTACVSATCFLLSIFGSFGTRGVTTPAVGIAALGALILGVGAILVCLRRRRQWLESRRVSEFLRQNSLDYAAVARVAHPGVFFTQGDFGRCENVVRRVRAPEFEVGEYIFSPDGGSLKSVHRAGYLMLKLGKSLPHLYLESKSRSWTRIRAASDLKRNQVLQLEGDFDRHFRLYCPRGYERDALYLFTPHVMIVLLDNAPGFDAEIVDDRLFFYFPGGMPLADPVGWARLMELTAAVWPALTARTSAYFDDRL
jgi:hypothetical protein